MKRIVNVPQSIELCKYLMKTPSVSGWVYNENQFEIDFYSHVTDDRADKIVKEIEKEFGNK